MKANVPDLVLEPMVRNALLEDLGSYGDITTRSVVPEDAQVVAEMNAREDVVVSGVQVVKLVCRLLDPALEVQVYFDDGAHAAKGETLLTIKGSAASVLMVERVALNFAGRLAGIATKTSAFVEAAKGGQARITCTRKTTPGLRIVEKLAVLHGGGFNHRYSLSDAILIKDNHIAAAGGVRQVLEAAKAKVSHMMAVELEVDTMAQLEEALSVGGADVVLLDNFSNEALIEAVALVNGRMKTEASGNVVLDRIPALSQTGVDYISSGALTHSARTVDLGLDF